MSEKLSLQQGWAGMTFEDSGTGREWKKSIPEIREREGNEKIHSQNSGTGREWKKSIPEIRERERNEKIHSHNSGRGIRGFYSWEWTERHFPLTPVNSRDQRGLTAVWGWLQRMKKMPNNDIFLFLHSFNGLLFIVTKAFPQEKGNKFESKSRRFPLEINDGWIIQS